MHHGGYYRNIVGEAVYHEANRRECDVYAARQLLKFEPQAQLPRPLKRTMRDVRERAGVPPTLTSRYTAWSAGMALEGR